MRNSSHLFSWRLPALGAAAALATALLVPTPPAVADEATPSTTAAESRAAESHAADSATTPPLGNLTDSGAPIPNGRHLFDRGHADVISTRLENGQLKLIARVDQPGELGKVFPVDSTRFWINDAARTTLSSDFAPAGAANEAIWLVRQSGMPSNSLWPGFSTELVPAGALDGQTTFSLDKVEGPANFRVVLMTDDPLGGREVWWHVTNDAAVKTEFSLGRQHAHSYWAFSHPGEYKLTVTAKANIGGSESRDTQVYHFVVGPYPQAAKPTDLTLQVKSGLVGEPVTFTARTLSTAVGYVEFYAGDALIGHAPVENGSATYSFVPTRPGQYAVNARFVPDNLDEFLPSRAAAVTAGVNEVKRIAGESRYSTSAALLAAGRWENEAVVMASGEGFADALAATPLAGALRAPLLLTKPDRLDAATRKALGDSHAAGVRNVILVGGTGTISGTVEKAVEEAGFQVKRIAGPTRVETAIEVSKQVGATLQARGHKVGRVFLVDGNNFPDALAAGPIASAYSGVLLLSNGAQVPAATLAYAQSLSAPVTAIGAAARSTSIPTAEKVIGSDRYQTSFLLTEKYMDGAPYVVLANGAGFADALSAGAYAAQLGGTLVLTPSSQLSAGAAAILAKDSVVFAGIIGGAKSVTPGVEGQVKSFLR